MTKKEERIKIIQDLIDRHKIFMKQDDDAKSCVWIPDEEETVTLPGGTKVTFTRPKPNKTEYCDTPRYIAMDYGYEDYCAWDYVDLLPDGAKSYHERNKKKKCTCGYASVYGEDTKHHSTYCDAYEEDES